MNPKLKKYIRAVDLAAGVLPLTYGLWALDPFWIASGILGLILWKMNFSAIVERKILASKKV